MNDVLQIVDIVVKLLKAKENINSMKDIYNISTLNAIIDNYIDKLKSKYNINDSMIEEYSTAIEEPRERVELVDNSEEIEKYKNEIEQYRNIVNDYKNKYSSKVEELLNLEKELKQYKNKQEKIENIEKYSLILENCTKYIKEKGNESVIQIKKDIEKIRTNLSSFSKEELEKIGLYDLYLITNDIINEVTAYEYIETNLNSLLDNINIIDSKIDELKQLKESNELLQQSINHSETIEDIKNYYDDKNSDDNIYEEEVIDDSNITDKEELLGEIDMTLKEEYKETKKGIFKFVIFITLLSITTASLIITYKLGYLDIFIDKLNNIAIIDEIKKLINNLL